MYQIEMQAIYQQHILDAQQCSQLSVFMKKIFDTKNEITRLYCLIENDNFDFLKVGNTGASYHRTVAFAKVLYNFCCLYFCSGFFLYNNFFCVSVLAVLFQSNKELVPSIIFHAAENSTLLQQFPNFQGRLSITKTVLFF